MLDCEGSPKAEVLLAGVQPLPALWPAEGVLPEVWYLPLLFPFSGSSRGNPRSAQSFLVTLMMTDPIADLLTRMRNALRINATDFSIPGSAMKVRILDVFKREGYIQSYEVHSDGTRSIIKVALKYGPEGEKVVTAIKRFSKPGCRRFRGVQDIPRVRGGLGVAVVSTNKGVLSDRECRQQNVGGEVLCTLE